jgi:hypothetical protein
MEKKDNLVKSWNATAKTPSQLKYLGHFQKQVFVTKTIFYYHLPLSAFETCVEKGLLFM